MMKIYRCSLLVPGILMLASIAVMLVLDTYLDDPEATKTLLYALAGFSILAFLLLAGGVYLELVRPLLILQKSLQNNEIPQLKTLTPVINGILQCLNIASLDSAKKVSEITNSHNKLATLNSILETGIKQLESEAEELSHKYIGIRTHTRKLSCLGKAHLQTFRGFLNLLLSELAYVKDKDLQQFSARVNDSAVHLDFLLHELLDLLGQRESKNTREEVTVDIRQLIDEMVACIAPVISTTTSKAKIDLQTRSATALDSLAAEGFDIVALTKPNCPAKITADCTQMKSLIFHYLSHCLTNESSGRLVFSTSYNEKAHSLDFYSDSFPTKVSDAHHRLNQQCSTGFADLDGEHLILKVKDPLWDSERFKALNILVLEQDLLLQKSISSRLMGMGCKTETTDTLEDIDSQTLKQFDLIIVTKINGRLLNMDVPIILIGTTKAEVNFYQIPVPLTQLRLQEVLDAIIADLKSSRKKQPAKIAGKHDSPSVFDPQISLSLANNKEDIAKDMLDMLVAALPGDLERIDKTFNNKDWAGLKSEIHRLSGAICFCSVPGLNQAVDKLNAINQSRQYNQLQGVIRTLHHEAARLYSWYADTKNPFGTARQEDFGASPIN